MRHIWLRLLGLVALASVSCAALAVNEVKLVSVRSNGCAPVSGCYATPFFTSTVEVQNLGYAKQVGIRYRTSAGAWESAPGQYLGPASAGRELWSVNMSAPSDSFAVYYTVNGVTYWDNNNSQNYATNLYRYDALLGAAPLGDPLGNWGPPEPGTSQNGSISGNLLIRNLSYAKTVRIVYTENNWATTREAFARYQATLPSGIELWQFGLPTAAVIDPSRVQIAFHYTWATGSAWDNNYGRNYRLSSIITR